MDKTDSVLNRYVAEMRDVRIQKDRMRFRRNIERIGELMSYELSKSLSYAPQEVTTPLGTATVNMPTDDIVVGTVLRAGLPMHQGVLSVFDWADNCFASAFRAYDDHHGIEIHLGYAATPKLDGKVLIMADPMLATGKSMCEVIGQLLRYGTPTKHSHNEHNRHPQWCGVRFGQHPRHRDHTMDCERGPHAEQRQLYSARAWRRRRSGLWRQRVRTEKERQEGKIGKVEDHIRLFGMRSRESKMDR